jgi:hypothetical protein
MAVASTERAPRRAQASSRVDRFLAAIPAAIVVLSVLIFYGVEAWARRTPWIFTDEVEWTDISRAIEATGHAARRGQPTYFKSVYAFFLAPFWAIHSTAAAYAAIKYAQAVLMTLAAVPTYLLAKMLVSKRAAFAVAFLSICIPGMAYAASIEPEVLAYPYYALASWLIVRSLTTGRRRDFAFAIAAALVAVLVRSPQFGTIPASFVIAAAGLWVTGPRGRALRRNWSRSDTLGAVVLLVGGLFLFNRIFLQHIQEWQISTQYWKNRMVDLGLRAGLAFTVGLGLLPVIGGFTALRLPERKGQPAYRAFAAYLAASIICVSLYTAVKAAYLSTVFATLWEERNMIYLSPLLLIGTALVFESRRIDWRIVAAAAAFVVFLFYVKPFQLSYGYFEAPGFGILTIANRWGWTVQELQYTLLVVLAVSLVLLVLRRRAAVAVLAVLLGAGWMLASEIQSSRAFDKEANAILANLPPHLNWVDRETHGQHVTYLGQEITNPDGLLEMEFWNRSIDHVDSLDGSAPGPGPAGVPDLVNTSGLLTGTTSDKYVLADDGVVLQSPIVDQWTRANAHLVLYHVTGPWKLGDALQQVYSDGWCPNWCSYTYFGPARSGTLDISIGRSGYNGNAPPGHVRLQVGTILIDSNQEPEFKHVYSTRWLTVRNDVTQVIQIPIAHAPVRVELRTPMSETFHVPEDPRNLSAQVAFKFIPAKTG